MLYKMTNSYLCKIQICASLGHFPIDISWQCVICCLCWAAFGPPFFSLQINWSLKNGLPRRCAPRNDSYIDLICTKPSAECNENHVIANQPAGWCGNPFPFRHSSSILPCTSSKKSTLSHALFYRFIPLRPRSWRT